MCSTIRSGRHANRLLLIGLLASTLLMGCGAPGPPGPPTCLSILGGLPSEVESLAFSPDGKTLAVGTGTFTIKLWDPVTGKEKATLEDRKVCYGVVSCLAFSPDSKILASGTYNNLDIPSQACDGKGRGAVTLWDTPAGTIRARLTGKEAPVEGLSFSPDGKTLAVASLREPVWLWDVQQAKQRDALGRDLKLSRGVAFSPDGKILAINHHEDGVKLWAVDGLLERAHIDTGCEYLVFSPDSNTLAAPIHFKVNLWSVNRKELISSFEGHQDQVMSVSFSPDGKILATGSWDKTVRLWDVATAKELAVLRGHKARIKAVAFSPNGKILVSGGGDYRKPGEVLVWDVAEALKLRK
jgi:WD40 repeat protein